MPELKRRVTILYHYFYPDDVVSSVHFSQFAKGLEDRGWDVEVIASNRCCRDRSSKYPLREQWGAISIKRIWRPNFKQNTTLGRILNALWMISAWSVDLVFRRKMPEILIIGTDPPLSILVGRFIKKLKKNVRIVHWCFDLYPEAVIAEGTISENALIIKFLKHVLSKAYSACDLIVDLGMCMRRRLSCYHPQTSALTIVPWALWEPAEISIAHEETRKELFGRSQLGILYSGNFGRAHACDLTLELADQLKNESICFCFSARGNRAGQLAETVKQREGNVKWAEFAEEKDLPKRLVAADIHIVTLNESWSGNVVPSKFFGSLAAGRPVLFEGPGSSSIAQWIEQYNVGWVLNATSKEKIAQEMKQLAVSKEKLLALSQRCFGVYRDHFSKDYSLSIWDRELRRLLK